MKNIELNIESMITEKLIKEVMTEQADVFEGFKSQIRTAVENISLDPERLQNLVNEKLTLKFEKMIFDNLSSRYESEDDLYDSFYSEIEEIEEEINDVMRVVFKARGSEMVKNFAKQLPEYTKYLEEKDVKKKNNKNK